MKLIFVYNADSGLFNTLTDIAHKLLSPDTYQCQLCAVTHSVFSKRDEWRSYIENLGIECEFLHRDEFKKRFQLDGVQLPAIFREQDGTLTSCAGAREINAIDSIDGLKNLLKTRCMKTAG